MVDKKTGAYHISFNHQRSTKRPKSNAKMYENQRREDWREKESTHYAMIISAWNTGTSTIFERCFNHFPLEDFSQTNRNRLVGAPRTHFRQELKIEKLPKLFLLMIKDEHMHLCLRVGVCTCTCVCVCVCVCVCLCMRSHTSECGLSGWVLKGRIVWVAIVGFMQKSGSSRNEEDLPLSLVDWIATSFPNFLHNNQMHSY